jgi:hypothetical protein
VTAVFLHPKDPHSLARQTSASCSASPPYLTACGLSPVDKFPNFDANCQLHGTPDGITVTSGVTCR